MCSKNLTVVLTCDESSYDIVDALDTGIESVTLEVYDDFYDANENVDIYELAQENGYLIVENHGHTIELELA